MLKLAMQVILLLMLSACSMSPTASADTPSTNRPFTTTPIATFDSPWAMAFIPGGNTALVTEKPGRIWLVDVSNGRKQPVSGAPSVVLSSQGGLLDIKLSPTFPTDKLVYLSYAEPSPNGGSSLALARARYDGANLSGLRVLWRDPGGGEGGQFGAIIAFAPNGKSLFLSSGERQRVRAQWWC